MKALVLAIALAAASAFPAPAAALASARAGPRAELPPSHAARAALAPGDTLDTETASLARGFLPPEILRHYERGEYRNPVAEWPRGAYRWEDSFVQATRLNRGRFALDEHGGIVERSSGKQPPLIYGFPFPEIDPADPQAGAKVVWNYYYGYWYLGNRHNVAAVVWLSPRGKEREVTADVTFLYYDGQTPRYRLPNPANLAVQYMAFTTAPADVHGTVSLSWRYRDPTRRDAVWAYVPAVRRVRAVSPTNRSDGFLGSDISQDDGPFFDGKPEDFTWKLRAERENLVLMDPWSLRHRVKRRRLPGGGWREVWPDIPVVGYRDPHWKGVAWAPVNAVLVRRRLWVVEGVPKDRYYLYGKLELSFDEETFQGVWNRKFSWQGEITNTYQVMAHLTDDVPAEGGKRIERFWGAAEVYACAENVRLGRATATGLLGAGGEAIIEQRVPVAPTFFHVENLERLGK